MKGIKGELFVAESESGSLRLYFKSEAGGLWVLNTFSDHYVDVMFEKPQNSTGIKIKK